MKRTSMILLLVAVSAAAAMSVRPVLAGQPATVLDGSSPAAAALRAKAPREITARLQLGIPQEVIILFDDRDIQQQAADMRKQSKERFDPPGVRNFKVRGFHDLKKKAFTGLLPRDFELLSEYGHLPLAYGRFHALAPLARLTERPEVKAVFVNQRLQKHLSESLPLINQPPVFDYGYTGAGSSVAVLDTGVDYTLAAFGSCAYPGDTPDCRVAHSEDIAPDDGLLDSNGHGTNVAGIVAGVAPGADIVSLDVFDGAYSSDAILLSAIDWAIANQQTYNIVAANISLGNGTKYTSPCSSSLLNPYVAAVANAKSAGILLVASAGNDAYIDGLSRPACTPDIVSVGAVYDSNVGGLAWTPCTDYTTRADMVTCFSNSADFLTLLAPGAIIDAAGYTKGGTSQAAPHAAGAIALLRSAFPLMSLEQTVARLTATGVQVTDDRNGIIKPRVNLFDALAPYDDEEIPMLPLWGVVTFFGVISGVTAKRLGKK